jgi:ketosteroid isomerase-like protein
VPGRDTSVPPRSGQRREARWPHSTATERDRTAVAAAPDVRNTTDDARTEAPPRLSRREPSNDSPAAGNAQTELRGHLAGWLGATNARDIEGQMRYYPDRVDNFYTTRGASRRSVQAEKRRIFGAASSVAMSASDPMITLGADGKTATMRFRKRYDIAGGRRSRKGEVLQELRWRRTDDGKWQIVSERDLRVLRRR